MQEIMGGVGNGVIDKLWSIWTGFSAYVSFSNTDGHTGAGYALITN